MTYELLTVPCLEDNYAFLLHNSDSAETLLVDVPDAPPIKAALDAQGWTLTDILLTHHHWDHVDGLGPLLAMLPAKPRIIGSKDDAHRLPALDAEVSNGEPLTICGAAAEILDVSGHTINHIAVYIEDGGVVFTADSLMALGCGRLFEGTPAQMWESMQKLRTLPPETRVCSGHEYTQTNARFAATIEPDNPSLISRIDEITKARADGLPTVPSTLAQELETNPFLRADIPALKAALNLTDQTSADVFAHVRKKRDNFQ
jgi:hydroxyacylglutathione hydrolase